MLFPKGRALHLNLDSSFVRIDALVSILEAKLFTGYLNVTSKNYEGVLVYYKGRLSTALDDHNGIRGIGSSAKQQIFSKGKEKDGTISVYSLPQLTVASLIKMGHLTLLYKDLSSDFADLTSLIEKPLQNGAVGCIDVTALDNQWTGIVILPPEQNNASFLYIDGKTTIGPSVIKDIGPLVSITGAIFNVFTTKGKMKQIRHPLKNNTPMKSGLPLRENTPSSEQLIVVWGDIISTIEKTIQPYVKKGFLYTFKTVLKEISVVYPFLHPISGGFYYENGKASFRGLTDQLSEALGKSLSAAVARLDEDNRKVNLSVLVKSALQPLLKKHTDVIKHYALESFCELFDMTLYDRVVVAARPFFGENTDRFLERQWLNKIGATSENLTPADLTALVAQLEKSAMLLISKNEVKQLCQQIEFIRNLY